MCFVIAKTKSIATYSSIFPEFANAEVRNAGGRGGVEMCFDLEAI